MVHLKLYCLITQLQVFQKCKKLTPESSPTGALNLWSSTCFVFLFTEEPASIVNGKPSWELKSKISGGPEVDRHFLSVFSRDGHEPRFWGLCQFVSKAPHPQLLPPLACCSFPPLHTIVLLPQECLLPFSAFPISSHPPTQMRRWAKNSCSRASEWVQPRGLFPCFFHSSHCSFSALWITVAEKGSRRHASQREKHWLWLCEQKLLGFTLFLKHVDLNKFFMLTWCKG